MKQVMMGWQWHQLDHMQIIAAQSRQITMPIAGTLALTTNNKAEAADRILQHVQHMHSSDLSHHSLQC